ncbi:MAG TPA: serine/threonine-protein kinase, partial [Polyangiaceae bacterium]|nr:serine/threonine-protein kinase [Polyangiaceae bacterium]
MSTILPEELPPNFEFGGYVIRACIGRGGMARVYRAEQAALQRPVALKVLDRWVLEQPQGAQRFLREARAAAAIKHPNVVDILDVGVWQERPYIVMELLSGTDLETHLAQYGVLSDSAVAGLALPIIAGMMAVHDAGVVHRDLKPSNIFLSNGPDGEIIPKVLDFGVSKFNDKLNEPIKAQTKTREIIGTPTYMAPEALNGVRELGPRGDQYSLGAVLYECSTGRPPFEGETLLELLKAIAVGGIPAPRSVRPELSITLE